ncbi:MAG TPA: QueT transporter family protein [Thermoclostridium sp.]|nr:QueT transporter family protein [Clostridiaceae bacterium]HOQ75779.1 QueT transporter family protein [Thermoclostridium sp.]HPU45442.1 QueT transporter family protein [Thermoclostridium sp.]
MRIKTRSIVQAAVIAAVYASLTLLIKPFAYGPIQFRISEALTVLPAVLPASIPGVFVGCVLANFLGGFGIVDIVLGSIATLLAGLSTWLLRKRTFLLPLPPVVFNGLIVGSYVYLLYDRTYPWPLTMLFIAISEAIVCYGLGLPLLSLVRKNRIIREALNITIE